MRKKLLFALLSILFFSSVYASDEKVKALTDGGPIGDPENFGMKDPCSLLGFQVSYTAPANYSVQKVDWYVNNVFVETITGGNPNVALTVTSQTFSVSCKVTYVNAQNQTTTGTSTAFNLEVKPAGLNDIVQNGPATLGCTSPVSFSTSVASNNLVYTPPQYSINWTLPSTWAFSSGSAGASITAVPDAFSSGNVVATLNIGCGYQSSRTLTITRPTPPAPTFSSNPVNVCQGSSVNFSINPACGATSYTWSLQGNPGLVFSGSNGQTFTTNATTVNIAASPSAVYADATLSVVANYSNGLASAAGSTGLHVGLPSSPPIPILGVPNGTGFCAGSSFNVYLGGQDAEITNYVWYVSPGSISAGQGTTQIAVQLPAGYTYSNPGEVVDGWSVTLQAMNACGTASWESSLAGNVLGCGGESQSSSTRAGSASATATNLNSTNIIALFPNPASDAVKVTVPGNVDMSKVTITLSDIYGRELKRIGSVSSVNSFSLSGLAAGVYLVKVYNGKQVITTKKLIKK